MIGHDRLSRLLAFDRDERVAIEWRGHRLTYSELAEAVEGLARTLGERGAARTNVLVLGPLCPAYVVALLAALRSGAVPMPVDTGMSAERYAWAEHVAQPSTVLTSDASSAAQYQGASSADELLLEAATGRVVLDIAARPGTGFEAPRATRGATPATSSPRRVRQARRKRSWAAAPACTDSCRGSRRSSHSAARTSAPPPPA